MPSVIAWLTDFGTRDHYVGTMKGVALSIAPDSAHVDITHEIAPQDVVGGGLELQASYSFFPSGTIFVVVVDPGVGTPRRAIAAAAGGYRFVGPDNGVLSPALLGFGDVTIVALTKARFALPTVSHTFEGRDRFAPAAGWLARGAALDDLGPRVGDIVRLQLPEPAIDGDRLVGEVMRVDRFGNAITNIPERVLADWSDGKAVVVRAGSATIHGVAETYGARPQGALCALVSSSGHLEVAVVGGSAAATAGLRRGAVVTAVRGGVLTP